MLKSKQIFKTVKSVFAGLAVSSIVLSVADKAINEDAQQAVCANVSADFQSAVGQGYEETVRTMQEYGMDVDLKLRSGAGEDEIMTYMELSYNEAAASIDPTTSSIFRWVGMPGLASIRCSGKASSSPVFQPYQDLIFTFDS